MHSVNSTEAALLVKAIKQVLGLGFIMVSDEKQTLEALQRRFSSPYHAPESALPQDNDSAECDWCKRDHSEGVMTSGDGNEMWLCAYCKSDMPQWLKDRQDDFIDAFCNDLLPRDIRLMEGSLKLFAKGIYSIEEHSDGGEISIVEHETMENLKSHIREEGGEEGSETKAVFKDGRNLNFSKQVHIDEA